MKGKEFTKRVRSGIDISIPGDFAQKNDIREGDYLTLVVTEHQREDEILFET